MSAHLSFAVELARQAGELLLRYFRLAELSTSLKADKSLVTEADLAADELIAAAVRREYPDDRLLSEELAPELGRAAGESAGPAVWIIDPLDGTTNFSLGLHVWGVVIARAAAGRPETAVLYFPLTGELYSAARGQGAHLNGEPIAVRPPQTGRPSAFFSCCSRSHRRYRISVPYKTRILGSAAYSLCAVARGAAVLAFEATPKIWDIAAGSLLVEEAGGVVGGLDGRGAFPLASGVDYGRLSLPTLAAADREVLEKAKGQILPRN